MQWGRSASSDGTQSVPTASPRGAWRRANLSLIDNSSLSLYSRTDPIYTYRNNEWNEQWVETPADYGEPLTLPNHPVVGVSWYEALAFARWLTDKMHNTASLPNDWVITLPSEAEWEKAARGPETSSGSARRYPWGDMLTANHANLQASNIGHSSAVGAFPLGGSLFGVEELMGNVWEWTRSLWGTDPFKADFLYPYTSIDGREDLIASDGTARIIRGESSYSGGAAGCARRYWINPSLGFVDRGFRIVASPSPLETGPSDL